MRIGLKMRRVCSHFVVQRYCRRLSLRYFGDAIPALSKQPQARLWILSYIILELWMRVRHRRRGMWGLCHFAIASRFARGLSGVQTSRSVAETAQLSWSSSAQLLCRVALCVVLCSCYLLQYPDFWHREPLKLPRQGLSQPDLLQPVAASLKCLLPKINEELTV